MRATGSTGAQPKVLLTVNARVADRSLHGGGDGRERRRTDFGELADSIEASIIDWDAVDQSRVGRVLRKRLGWGPAAALCAFVVRKNYDVIWCFTEMEGLVLAFLFKLFNVRKKLFFISIEPTSRNSMLFLRRLKVWTHFTMMLPTSTYQADAMIRTAGVPEEKVRVLPYQVDCKFFSPHPKNSDPSKRPLIVAAGLESRDYLTLVRAVAGLDVDVFIAAASLWSGDIADFPADIPSNVQVGRLDYMHLRDLYQRATVAVVPLVDSPYQHGITAIQEAMAMQLPVVVTRTRGQGDVVIDRRSVLRSDPAAHTRGTFAQLFQPGCHELQQSNGLYVGPGDEIELRKCINYLIGQPDVAEMLGANARRFACEVLSIELFVERSINLIRQAQLSSPVEGPKNENSICEPIPAGSGWDWNLHACYS